MSLFCFCDVYNNKKHQLGAGKCTGVAFATSYYLYEKTDCHDCNCNDNGTCAVADGIEGIEYCQVYERWESSGGYPEYFHPLPDDFLENKMENEWMEFYSSANEQ